MEKEINSDIIIVGGGIAGILTAFSLLKYDPSIKLTLIDNQFHAAAWRIAAGIINPVAGKRIVKTANIDLLMSSLLDCNAALHYQTGKHYFFSMPIVRVFRDQSEQLSWDKKIQKEDYHAWLSPYSQTLLPIHTPHGAGIIHGGGRLDIVGLIHDIKAWLSTQCTILHNTFHQEISFSSEQTIIMCYGWEMMYNPYWSWLPFAPFKGEVLTVKMPSDFSSTFILNNGTYFLPLTNGTARIGATIEHDALTYTPTEQAREELLSDFTDMTNIIPDVLAHHVGIRPGIEDRYPVIGSHPMHKNIMIVNGLGGRGALYGAFCAQSITDNILLNNPILPEYSVERYYYRFAL
jgi:glycine oxidase